jgi:hypothetical protein
MTIIQGEDKDITVTLQTLNLTTATEILVRFPGSRTQILKTLTNSGGVTRVNDATGKFKVTLSNSETPLLKLGLRDMEITVSFGSVKKIFHAIGQIQVKAQLP